MGVIINFFILVLLDSYELKKKKKEINFKDITKL